jgi:hypothetical protein
MEVKRLLGPKHETGDHSQIFARQFKPGDLIAPIEREIVTEATSNA